MVHIEDFFDYSWIYLFLFYFRRQKTALFRFDFLLHILSWLTFLEITFLKTTTNQKHEQLIFYYMF